MEMENGKWIACIYMPITKCTLFYTISNGYGNGMLCGLGLRHFSLLLFVFFSFQFQLITFVFSFTDTTFIHIHSKSVVNGKFENSNLLACLMRFQLFFNQFYYIFYVLAISFLVIVIAIDRRPTIIFIKFVK